MYLNGTTSVYRQNISSEYRILQPVLTSTYTLCLQQIYERYRNNFHPKILTKMKVYNIGGLMLCIKNVKIIKMNKNRICSFEGLTRAYFNV